MKRRLRAAGRVILAVGLVLGTASPVWAEAIRSIEKFLANDGGDLPFEGVRNRIAMFTFEDPDGTGLGDDVAFLTSKRVLFGADVNSLAVILFEQGLAPDASGLSYFEKVDRITLDRNFVAALWGHISRDGAELVVDTFVQLYPDRAPRLFGRRFGFQAFGAEHLQASVAPRRIWVQSARLPLSAVDAIRAIAESVRTLREGPNRAAPAVADAFLREGATYRVVDREGGWTRVVLTESGLRGWTSVDALCGSERICAGLIAGADFLNELLRYVNGRGAEVRVPDEGTRAARAVGDQVRLIDLLEGSAASPGRFEAAVGVASEWTEGKRIPGGASFANLWAVARLRHLESARDLNPETVQPVANHLARASLDDPGNLDVLHNLSVLFRFLGDSERSQLADTLYQRQAERSGR